MNVSIDAEYGGRALAEMQRAVGAANWGWEEGSRRSFARAAVRRLLRLLAAR